MDNYRIRAYTPAGLQVFQMGFSTSTDVDAYWNNLFKENGLAPFAKMGYVILAKEHLTQGGNWEADLITPVEVTV